MRIRNNRCIRFLIKYFVFFFCSYVQHLYGFKNEWVKSMNDFLDINNNIFFYCFNDKDHITILVFFFFV